MAALMHAHPPPSLYAHTVGVTLAQAIRTPSTEYLVEDLRTREILADTFSHPETPVPVGSLLKPFLVFAHVGPFPTVTCHGHATGCWRASGHGSLTLVPALAFSCNTYFLTLAAGPIASDRLAALGLSQPPSEPARRPPDLIGLTPAWQIAPLTLAEAYARLAPQLSPELRAGLAQAAAYGTASAVGRHPGGVLAKTGTAPCPPHPQQPCRTSGDGWTLALAPALHPTTLVLVRRRATTGAATAEVAGQILTTLVQLHAY